ncbi:hypothetical protein ARMGADRAFT_1040561 [Armillaria gallica]|uniref:CxC2-like cysteine cluster KDZ transposase-associated domain-containing protein n=1 Tax=Armillaria gallica TaxID=47427 RepID=A0A2H3C9L0_ARMGA|nr:hypothetical protein ARMGADRAFT_1040561 [Armillaria gallica]
MLSERSYIGGNTLMSCYATKEEGNITRRKAAQIAWPIQSAAQILLDTQIINAVHVLSGLMGEGAKQFVQLWNGKHFEWFTLKYIGLHVQLNHTMPGHQEFKTTAGWRHLKILKQGGKGHVDKGVKTTQPYDLTILCPSCLQPGINLPEGWEELLAELKFLYVLLLCMDANFHLKNQMASLYSWDPELGIGWGYFVPREPYDAYVLNHTSDEYISTCVGFAALAKQDTKYLVYQGWHHVMHVCTDGLCIWLSTVLVSGDPFVNLQMCMMTWPSEISVSAKAHGRMWWMTILAFETGLSIHQWLIKTGGRVLHATSADKFLVLALALEESLNLMICQDTALTEQCNVLREKLHSWLVLWAIYLPRLIQYLTEIGKPSGDDSDENPEVIKLWLPSNLPKDRRRLISKLKLAGPGEWEETLQILDNKDIRSYTDPDTKKCDTGRHGNNEGNDKPTHASDEEVEEEELMLEVEERSWKEGMDGMDNNKKILHAEWCKSWAHVRRSMEKAEWWEEPQTSRDVEGDKGLAEDQSKLQRKLKAKFSTVWKTPLEEVELQPNLDLDEDGNDSSDDSESDTLENDVFS